MTIPSLCLPKLQNVETPMEEWWEAASYCPKEAMESPLYDLFLLESPDRWILMEQQTSAAWTDRYFASLSWEKKHLFVADCAEHVLPLFEARWPDNDVPRQSITLRRQFAKNEVSAKVWRFHSEAFFSQCYAKWRYMPEGLDRRIMTISVAAACERPQNAFHYAAEAREATNRIQEFVWQWRRLLTYL